MIKGSLGRDGLFKTMHAKTEYSPEQKENRGKPGPGNYNPDALKNKLRNPSYGMGTAGRIDLLTKKNQMYQQGPGQYNPKIHDGSSKWGFGT